MEGIVNIITFCAWLGTILLCVFLIIYAVLRWLKPDETRMHRLNILAAIAFAILCILFLIHWEAKKAQGDVNSDGTISWKSSFFELSTDAIGELLFGTIMAFAIVLLLIVILCICNGIWILLSAKSTGKSKGTKSSSVNVKNPVFFEAIKSPVVVLIMAGGIVSLYLVIPFLVGERTKENLIEIWKDGVIKIAKSVISTDSGSDAFCSKVLSTYTLVYIILLGVGLVVVKILYSLIIDAFRKKKNANLIDTYSSPIALLAVGVSLLWLFRGGDFPRESEWETIVELLKSVVTVIVVAAIIIMTLEIIRLLMDMREKIIRQEAKYIFISLIGKSALLMLGMLNSIYGAISSAIGSDRDTSLSNVEMKLKKKIVRAMKDVIYREEDSPVQCSDKNESEHEIVFIPFKESVTKK